MLQHMHRIKVSNCKKEKKTMKGNIKSTFLKVSNILLRILSLTFFQFCLQKQYRLSRPLHSCLEMQSRTKKMLIKLSDISSDFSCFEIESSFFRISCYLNEKFHIKIPVQLQSLSISACLSFWKDFKEKNTLQERNMNDIKYFVLFYDLIRI